MPLSLPEPLLALAAAISDDGGVLVRRVLAAILAEAAPFDAAEIALRRGGGTERWSLGAEEVGPPITADDLLDRVTSLGEALRIDDLPEADPYPRTHARLAEQGFRSLLAVPFTPRGGPEGMIVIARRQGWAFVGASLHVLRPVAGMAGLALDRALALGAGPPLPPVRLASAPVAAPEEPPDAVRELKKAWEAAVAHGSELQAKLEETARAQAAQAGELEHQRTFGVGLAAELESAAGEREAARAERAAALEAVREAAQRGEVLALQVSALEARLEDALRGSESARAQAAHQHARAEALSAEAEAARREARSWAEELDAAGHTIAELRALVERLDQEAEGAAHAEKKKKGGA